MRLLAGRDRQSARRRSRASPAQVPPLNAITPGRPFLDKPRPHVVSLFPHHLQASPVPHARAVAVDSTGTSANGVAAGKFERGQTSQVVAARLVGHSVHYGVH